MSFYDLIIPIGLNLGNGRYSSHESAEFWPRNGSIDSHSPYKSSFEKTQVYTGSRFGYRFKCGSAYKIGKRYKYGNRFKIGKR
jgi:hypothetical protein